MWGCMYLSRDVCMYVGMYVYTYVGLYVCVWGCMYVCVWAVCTYVYGGVCMWFGVYCMYICVWGCMYVCGDVCMCVDVQGGALNRGLIRFFSLYRPSCHIEAYIRPEKYCFVWAGTLANLHSILTSFFLATA